jgi:cytidine deaminase
MTDAELVAHAKGARKKAYAPYSHYYVGCALLSEDGAVFTGCNVENIVLPETVCAEKVALVKAVSEGHTEIEVAAVVTDSDPPATPCGSCRQMLYSWGVKRVLVANIDGEFTSYDMADLLPHAFRLTELPRGR